MRFAFLFLLLVIPLWGHAAPMLSEIAWMGTDADANNEWIEIYNFGTAPTDLAGWTLTSGSGLSISLSGTLGPHGVGVLERSDDATVPTVSALHIYTGALPNTGDSASLTLTLRDEDGTVVDEVVGGSDWSLIGGSNTVPKKTAQRARTGTWVTAAPTPGAENAQVNDVPPQDENDDTNDSEDEEDDQVEETTETATKSSGSNKRTTIVKSTAELTLTLTAPEVVYVEQPVSFVTTASGPGRDIMNSLVYTWNFGDTYTGSGKTTTHTYRYPGEYVVVVNAQFGKHDVTVQKSITVLAVGVSITRSPTGDVILTNTAGHDIDISGYMLRGTESVVLPPYTYLRKGGTITIAKSRVASTGNPMLALYDTDRSMVASESPLRATTPVTATSPMLARVSSLSSRTEGADSSKPATAIKSTSKETVPERAVAGTSTIFEGLTIPVYAAENESVVEQGKSYSRILPYAGLATIIVVAILLLYRRPETEETG